MARDDDSKRMPLWMIGFVILVPMLLSAAGVIAISLRYRMSRASSAAWLIASIALGFGGLLGLIATRAWPRRVRCGHCRKIRFLDEEFCRNCAATFPPPPMQEIEVFDQTCAA